MTVASRVIDAELRTDGPAGVSLRKAVERTLDAHWRPPGFACPNAERYPWMWLWDSCFHAIVWSALDRPDRAVSELRAALAGQDPHSGFVPHMAYFGASSADATEAATFWGTGDGSSTVLSSITQPPMYGHAVAELTRRGLEVPPDVVSAAVAGLRFLLADRRRHGSGLIELVHPWESGCDDSPRWDDVVTGPWSIASWRETKGSLLDTIDRGPSGAPIANDGFAVASIGFNALVAFNASELASAVDGSVGAELRHAASTLTEAIDGRWLASQRTWVDAGPTESGSGRCRTADALLPLLVVLRAEAVEELADPAAFGAPFGPRGVHLAEPVRDPRSYWRGPAWPQLSYLLWLAATRHGQSALADRIALGTSAAAERTGLAEYWDGDTGTGGGAVPQSWTALALLMAPDA